MFTVVYGSVSDDVKWVNAVCFVGFTEKICGLFWASCQCRLSIYVCYLVTKHSSDRENTQPTHTHTERIYRLRSQKRSHTYTHPEGMLSDFLTVVWTLQIFTQKSQVIWLTGGGDLWYLRWVLLWDADWDQNINNIWWLMKPQNQTP